MTKYSFSSFSGHWLNANPQVSVGNPLLNLLCEYLDVHYGIVKILFHFFSKK